MKREQGVLAVQLIKLDNDVSVECNYITEYHQIQKETAQTSTIQIFMQEPYYHLTNSREKHQKKPLSINNEMQHNNEYNLFRKNVKEEHNEEVLEEHEYEDTKYNIDITEFKTECSLNNDNLSYTRIHGDNSQTNNSNRRNQASASGKRKYVTSNLKECEKMKNSKRNKVLICSKNTDRVIKNYEHSECSKDPPCQETKTFECNYCHEMFCNIRGIRSHIIQKHIKEKGYECVKCHKTFYKVRELKKHISVHKTELNRIKTFKCCECQNMFSSGSLRSHIAAVHKQIKTFECSQCNQVFFSKQVIIKHIDAVHNKIKDILCHVCCKMFSRMPDLQRHIDAVHRKIKNLKCSECHRMFFKINDIRKHITSVHNRIRNYECFVCKKRFFRSSHLTRHIRDVHRCTKNGWKK